MPRIPKFTGQQYDMVTYDEAASFERFPDRYMGLRPRAAEGIRVPAREIENVVRGMFAERYPTPHLRLDHDIREDSTIAVFEFRRTDTCTSVSLPNEYFTRYNPQEVFSRPNLDRVNNNTLERVSGHVAIQVRDRCGIQHPYPLPISFREQEVAPMATEAVLTLATIQNAVTALREHEAARELSYENYFRAEFMAGFERQRHGMWDRMREGLRDRVVDEMFHKTRAKPEAPEVIAWLAEAKVPQTIVGNRFGVGMVARLLDDTMKLWQESEDMRHCIYKSYTDRIMVGKYIAYHIDAPGLTKSGFTVGFYRGAKKRNRSAEDQALYGVSPAMGAIAALDLRRAKDLAIPWQGQHEWVLEQIKGKANSRNEDAGLRNFAEYIGHQLETIGENCG